MPKRSNWPSCPVDSWRKYYLYRIYGGIKGRCLNVKNARYPLYGGRGITLHNDWIKDFPAFMDYILSNLGNRPSNNYSLDRIDNNKGYQPGNLRWATQKEQMRNTRSNRHLTINGVTKCISDWCRETGASISQIYGRLKGGWPIDKSLFDPIDARSKRKTKIKVGKECTDFYNLSKVTNIPVATLRWRYNTGLRGKALAEPVNLLKSKAGKSSKRRKSNHEQEGGGDD